MEAVNPLEAVAVSTDLLAVLWRPQASDSRR